MTTPATVAASVAGNVFFTGADEFAVITATFTVGGVLTDPTTVTLTITDPSGTQTTPSPTHLSTGKYSYAAACTAEGQWSYTWDGSGAAAGVYAGTFLVGTTVLNQFYCSAEQLKSRLGIDDNVDDLEIGEAVESASRSVDEICGRFFWRTASTEVRTYIPTSIYAQEIDDLVTVTTVKADRDGDGVYEETWTLDVDYQLQVAPGHYNTGALGEQWPYTRFNIVGPKFVPIVWPWSHLNRIQVTGVFGWPSVPLAVRQATLIAAADLFRLKDAPFGIAGFGEFAVRIQQNPRVMSLLKRYIKADRVGV